MKQYDYLIVGSGLFGATFAYKAAQAGKKCLVIDKRPHAGGNVYCSPISVPSPEGKGECVINVHTYGAHIFHTSNKNVWDFVNSLVPFNRYTNSPIANYKGELYNLPFNMNTFCQIWPDVKTPVEAKARINEQVNDAIKLLNGENGANGEYVPRNLEEQALLLVGRDIYEKLIKEYTEKQWGRKCTELPAFIIRRLPLRFVFDNNYFNDLYQGIPIGGYNLLIEKLLEGSEVRTNVDFFGSGFEELLNSFNLQLSTFNHNRVQAAKALADTIVYTGQLDEYFDYKLGRLDWRTVSFKTRVEDMPNYQGNAVVNYTSHEVPYTRVIEHKHFELFGQAVYDVPKTVVSEEYSTEFKPGMEPYYPVNDERNNSLADQYRALAEAEPNVIFGGRLAEYKYYDMDKVIERALAQFKEKGN
ncbi:MAG: UDP-galactopyranose mutase [Paludibacteraceae bacterium]|nr:UDP-galactopyranose mutase [Paludibacteraceae bacterium]